MFYLYKPPRYQNLAWEDETLTKFHHLLFTFHFLHQSVDGQLGLLAIGQSRHHAAEFALLVGDAHIHVWYLVVVIHLRCFRYQRVAGLGAVQEHDVVLYAEGQSSVTVHHGSQCNVGQREVGTALTYPACIQVLWGHQHFRTGIPLTYLFQYASAIRRKAVVLR